MTKFFTLPTQIGILLIGILLISILEFSQAVSSDNLLTADISSDDDSADLQEERRSYNLKKLRHFLLTSNAEQRAAKRDQQEFYKRELVNKL
jgi:hypothetical protein